MAGLLGTLPERYAGIHALFHGFNGYEKTLELLICDPDTVIQDIVEEVREFYDEFGVDTKTKSIAANEIGITSKGIQIAYVLEKAPKKYYVYLMNEPLLSNLEEMN